jgi:hypothetical protein
MNALIVAVLDADLETAIQETVQMLHDGQTDELEGSWAYLCVKSGERLASAEDAAPWSKCVSSVWDAMNEADAIKVSEAATISARLCLLHKRLMGVSAVARPSAARLREQIAEFFPEGAQLSPKGATQFKLLLPDRNSADEKALAHRILAGLCKLWSEGRTEDVRIAVDYLSRRAHVLPLSNWPAPSLDEAVRGDIVWFLWGALLIYHKQVSSIKAAHGLFSWKWRRGAKKNRMGLLLGAIYVVVTEEQQVESARDVYILGQVRDVALEMWRTQRSKTKTATNPAPSGSDDRMTFFCNYVPRCGIPERIEETAEIPPSRLLNISTKEAKNATSGRYAAAPNIVSARGGGVGTSESSSPIQDFPEEECDRQPMDQYISLLINKRAPMEARHEFRRDARPEDRHHNRI